MDGILPAVFMGLAVLSLLFAVSSLWASLRGLLGADTDHALAQSQAAQRRAEWSTEKEAVLRSLKDLEFERDVGKLSNEDYERLHAQFRARAKQLMRLLDDDLKEYRVRARALIAEASRAAEGKES